MKVVQVMKEADQAMEEAAVAHKNVDQAMTQLSRTRNGYRSQTSMFNDAESDSNHRLCKLAPAGAVHCSGHGSTLVRNL